MKELTIEQKAQRYNEALQRTRKWYDVNTNEGYRSIFEDIFPELAESNDERIELLNYLYDVHDDDEERARWIAWLEKQGEQETIDKIQFGKKYKCIASPRYSVFMKGEIYVPKDKFLCSLMNLCFDCFEPIEDDEQKPADKVEPKFKVGDTIAKKHNSDIYDFGSFTITDITGGKYWYNDRIICDITEQDEWEIYEPVRQNPAWSEEDVAMLDSAIAFVEHSAFTTIGKGKNNVIDWLKSLKDRVQPKQEWNEEGERNIKELLYLVEANYLSSEEPHDRLINFLESLRPQNTWKPSDEHYELKEFVKIVRGNLTGISKDVQELFKAKYLQLTGNKMYGGFKD